MTIENSRRKVSIEAIRNNKKINIKKIMKERIKNIEISRRIIKNQEKINNPIIDGLIKQKINIENISIRKRNIILPKLDKPIDIKIINQKIDKPINQKIDKSIITKIDKPIITKIDNKSVIKLGNKMVIKLRNKTVNIIDNNKVISISDSKNKISNKKINKSINKNKDEKINIEYYNIFNKYILRRREINIIFLANTDYANVLTEWSNSLNIYSNKFKSLVICLQDHPYNFILKHDINLNTIKKMYIQPLKKLILKIEYIVISYEKNTLVQQIVLKLNKLLDINILALNKKIIYFFPGSHYRLNYPNVNKILCNKSYKNIYAPDLYRLSKQSLKDISFFPIYKNKNKININDIIDNKFRSNKLIILHCPSNKNTKGSETINQIINRIFKSSSTLNNKFNYIETEPHTSHQEIIKLKQLSMIYIDQFDINIGGYGVSAIEAISSGNIVFASIGNISKNVLCRIWKLEIMKDFPIVDTSNSEIIFENNLKEYMSKTRDELKICIKKSYDWYKDYMNQEYFCNIFDKFI